MTTMNSSLLVRSIAQLDAHTLGIEWVDGHKSQWRLAYLRRNCPCAACVDEWTGAPILDPHKIDEQLSAKRVESIGRYALMIEFGDGHNTGIYTFTYLRELCQCKECEKAF